MYFKIRKLLVATLLKTVYKVPVHSSGPVLWVHKQGKVCVERKRLTSEPRVLNITFYFLLSKYVSCSNTYHFSLQTSLRGDVEHETSFCFLYKLNCFKWNPLNIEENGSTEPLPKIISCSHRRGMLHNAPAFFQSLSLLPLLQAAAKAWGERHHSDATSHLMLGLPPKTMAIQYHLWCLVLWQAQLSSSLCNMINSFCNSMLHSWQIFLRPPLPVDLGWIWMDFEAKGFLSMLASSEPPSSDITSRTGGTVNTLFECSPSSIGVTWWENRG